jgi:hypothetical protein
MHRHIQRGCIGAALGLLLIATPVTSTVIAQQTADRQSTRDRPVAGHRDVPADTLAARAGLVPSDPQGPRSGRGGPQGPGRQRQGFQGGQRQLSMLNPEISMTGELLGWYLADEVVYPDPLGETSTGEPGFIPTRGSRLYLREVELNVVAPLDPYTRGKFFLTLPEGGSLEIEEAYMQWINLPAGLSLKIGRFRNQFGQLNRWHEHALPNIDRPTVLYALFGRDGLAGTGISTNWLLGSLLAHVHELDVEMINGGDGISFTADGTEDRVLVARLKNYWDVSPSAYLEVGLSGAHGHWDAAGQYVNRIAGVDLNYKWIPIGRGNYRTFELRAEAFRSERDTPTGRLQSDGGYLLFQNRMGARWWLGARADYAEHPFDPTEIQKGGVVSATYWQSEFVFFRFQYGETLRDFTGDDRRFMVQVAWSMGPHKHEAY